MIDGVVAGVWHQRRSERKLHVTVEPLRKLKSNQQRELADQVERVARIVDAVPDLTIGQVAAGPHA